MSAAPTPTFVTAVDGGDGAGDATRLTDGDPRTEATATSVTPLPLERVQQRSSSGGPPGMASSSSSNTGGGKPKQRLAEPFMHATRRSEKPRPSGQQRNCFTISTVARQGIPTSDAAPPSTKYGPVALSVMSTHERPKGGTITPLPKPNNVARARVEQEQERRATVAADARRSRLSRRGNQTPDGRIATPGIDVGPEAESPTMWRRVSVDREDPEALVSALRHMPVDQRWTSKPIARWSPTPVDRTAGIQRAMGTALATPSPGSYDTSVAPLGGSLCKGGSIPRGRRFSEKSSPSPGPGAYRTSVAPRKNTRGVDFSKAPGGRCMGGAGYFVSKRSASAMDGRSIGGGLEFPSAEAPGPGSYESASHKAAFGSAHQSAGLGHDLSPVAASFLAQRIPFDASVASPAVIADIAHVRAIADDLERHRLRA